MDFSSSSSLDEVVVFVNSLDRDKFYSQNDIIELLVNCSKIDLESIEFIYLMSQISRKIGKRISGALETILDNYYKNRVSADEKIAFCSYFTLSYYYRDFEKDSLFEIMFNKHNDMFSEFVRFPAFIFDINVAKNSKI